MGSSCRPSRDHPRIRGEHFSSVTKGLTDAGSSPHTRGALEARHGLVLGDGIIPAYAGSTAGPRASCSTAWDHPRIRGEHSTMLNLPSPYLGSSPHTRGARVRGGRRPPRAGIIPAYAGSTGLMLLGAMALRDHPRIRGEHRNRCRCTRGWSGSSPHTRGALDGWRVSGEVGGIIPAYAGSTAPRHTCWW